MSSSLSGTRSVAPSQLQDPRQQRHAGCDALIYDQLVSAGWPDNVVAFPLVNMDGSLKTGA
jgi:hypothetical protein